MFVVRFSTNTCPPSDSWFLYDTPGLVLFRLMFVWAVVEIFLSFLDRRVAVSYPYTHIHIYVFNFLLFLFVVFCFFLYIGDLPLARV